MIKNILLVTLLIIVVWMSQDYFTANLHTNSHESKKSLEIIKKDTLQQIKTKKNKIIKPKSDKENITLLDLLKENRFYDALAFYLEHNRVSNMEKMELYLAKLADKNPNLALEYMHVFLDNEPQSSVLTLMIETNIKQKNFAKAIALIMQAKENYVSETEDRRLSTQLKDISIKHIDRLLELEEYGKLIAFLEEMIDYDNTDSFYSFHLAQLYVKLDKVDEASPLLEGLQYDETYAQNVKTLLQSIDKEEDESYKYAIPLQKYGEHYAVNVLLDGNAFTLMLDTGATYIFIDKDKASMLTVIRDDLVLQTAGNDVKAKLCKASLSVGNLELPNIQVTVAPFKRSGIDGLLGMNFFKHFTFFINQDENVLYLNPKSNN